jgi:hypothetical protein
MSFSGNTLCTSYKKELMLGQHIFDGTHTFKIALYTEDASLDAASTDYSTTNEVTGTGYSAGGAALTPIAPATSGVTAFTDFEDVVFSNVTLTARGALIYNSTAGGGVDTTNAVAVLDFGRNVTKTAQDLTIVFPTGDALNAILRL